MVLTPSTSRTSTKPPFTVQLVRTASFSNNIDSVRVEGGTDGSIFTGDGDLNETTILEGAAADSLSLTGTATGGYFDGAAGADTLVFAGIAGSSTAKATVLGGEGSDTLGSTGQYAYTSLTGGAGADSIYTTGSTSDADNATILVVTATTPLTSWVVPPPHALRVKLVTTPSRLMELSIPPPSLVVLVKTPSTLLVAT